MDAATKEKLQQAGVDIAGAMERFMNNDALLERFLKKFLDDKYFGELVDAVENGDNEKAFTSCHTLKGLCGNLSLSSMYKIVSEQTEFFRSGDFEGGAAMMPKVSEEYEKITASIRENLL